MGEIFIQLLILAVFLCLYIRYKPSFDTTDDGDVILWYWSRLYVPSEKKNIKSRRCIILFNIVN